MSATRGTLFVVATPIGNAEDITERAKRILAEVDIIAAEDTRSTGLLLKALGIKSKLVSYHKFNEKHREDFLLTELERGMNVAIVSDAGTPCISDPGAIIVAAAAARGVRVAPVCGASAVTAALSVCGFEFDSYAFYGFLPRSAKSITETIAEARKSRAATSVFYESPKRVRKSLEIFDANAPDTSLCLCNDLTKTYERIYRGTPERILEELIVNPSAEKGEYTLVCMFGKENDLPPAARPLIAIAPLETAPALSPEAAIADYLVKRGGTPKDAADFLSNAQYYTKKELYKATNNLYNILRKNKDGIKNEM